MVRHDAPYKKRRARITENNRRNTLRYCALRALDRKGELKKGIGALFNRINQWCVTTHPTGSAGRA